MPLLEMLNLRLPAAREVAVGAKNLTKSTVTLHNRSGSALRLLGAQLRFDTARFVPPPPGRIDAHGSVVFTVEESTLGAARTAGFARYHVERKKHDVNVRFSWGDGTNSVETDGDGPFTQFVDFKEDSEKGNSYVLVFHENFDNRDPTLVWIRLANRSGAALTLVSSTLVDGEHSEFGNAPYPQVAADKIVDFMVRPLDDEHVECAGNVVYRIESKDQPRLVKMSWRRAATPVAKLVPDDGRFIAEPHRNSDTDFAFVVKTHDGPPPKPPGPAKIAIVNRAGFALTDPQASLDGRKARFNPAPPERIEGGSKGGFVVESADPEFPEIGGFVTYRLRLDPPDPANPSGEHELMLAWSDSEFGGRIAPRAKDCDVAKSGSRAAGFVFTVTGPALAFDPPAKVKQPTLRKGDKSADGWVEYLQEALNHHINAGLVVDGDFGTQTLKAVKAFQRRFKKEGVLEDGVVGDQTWSYLREGVPEKPATDKRKPHTYVEKGVEARWVAEKGMLWYDAGEDTMLMHAISVGDVSLIEGRSARFRIVAPDGRHQVLDRPFLKGQKSSDTGQGWRHNVAVRGFSTLFDEAATGGPPPGDYQVSAYLPGDLGGDSYSGVLTIAAKAPPPDATP